MSRIYLTLLLFVVSTYAADNDCNCDNLVGDDEKIWKYLKQMSIDVPEAERAMYSVLPGVLSPLVACNCEENNREKRKVDSKEIPDIPESEENTESEEDLEKMLAKLRPNVHTSRNCARGYIRFGFICVLEQDSLE